MKFLTVFPPMNLCLGGTILLISLWGWLKVVPEILLEKKKRKVVAQGGQMWKTVSQSQVSWYGSAAPCASTLMLFVCVTSEHGGNAPTWNRGLLAMGTRLILTESRSSPAARAITEAAVRHFRGVVHVSIVHTVLCCAWRTVLNMHVCIAHVGLH